MLMTNKSTKLCYYPVSISICTVEKFAHICVPILQSDLAQKETQTRDLLPLGCCTMHLNSLLVSPREAMTASDT